MHASVMNYIQEIVNKYRPDLVDKHILEIDSRDINGSVRSLFETTNYKGIDMIDGPGVDEVMTSHDIKYPDNSFDMVLSLEVLEHDEKFWVSLKEMGRVLKPHGIMIITTRDIGFFYHPYPCDYWRFTKDSAGPICELSGTRLLECRQDPEAPGIFIESVKI